MNYKKVLTKLGLIEGVDFALTETSFEMLEQTRQVLVDTIHHDAIPAVIDEDGITVLSPEVPAWDEQIFEDELYTKEAPSEETMVQTWKQIQLAEADMGRLINEYLADKFAQKDADDEVSFSNGVITVWNFKNIVAPTQEQLLALIPVVEAKKVAEKALRDAADLGARIRQVCNMCYDIVVGINVARQLPSEQVNALDAAFAEIKADLVDLKPWQAKIKIQAVPVDGTLVTAEMKAMILSLLAQF